MSRRYMYWMVEFVKEDFEQRLCRVNKEDNENIQDGTLIIREW